MGLLMHEMGRESGENALQGLSYMFHLSCLANAANGYPHDGKV